MAINVCSVNGEYEYGRVNALRRYFRSQLRQQQRKTSNVDESFDFESSVVGVTVSLNGLSYYQAVEFKDDTIPLIGVRLIKVN